MSAAALDHRVDYRTSFEKSRRDVRRGRSSRSESESRAGAPPAAMSSQSLRVAYIHSEELVETANTLPANVGRHRLAHELIRAHGLLELPDEAAEGDKVKDGGRARAYVVEPLAATREQLIKFHDERFVGKFSGVGVSLASSLTTGALQTRSSVSIRLQNQTPTLILPPPTPPRPSSSRQLRFALSRRRIGRRNDERWTTWASRTIVQCSRSYLNMYSLLLEHRYRERGS